MNRVGSVPEGAVNGFGYLESSYRRWWYGTGSSGCPTRRGMDRTSAALVVLAAHDRVGEPPREVPADTEGIGRGRSPSPKPGRGGTALRNRRRDRCGRPKSPSWCPPRPPSTSPSPPPCWWGLEHLVGRQRAADLLSPAVAEPNREEGVVALGQRAVGGLVGLDRGAQGLVVVESQRRVPYGVLMS